MLRSWHGAAVCTGTPAWLEGSAGGLQLLQRRWHAPAEAANSASAAPLEQVAAFLPLRLVGALGGSYVILAEQMDNSWEAGGAVLVLLTLSW